MGVHPQYSKITEPRYKTPNNTEVTPIRRAAPIAPGAPRRDGKPRRIRAVAPPASNEASRYLHTASIMIPTLRFIGFPAYQNAGIVRIQNEAVQATAIPTGPHRSASRNKRPVNANSTRPQRNQRSALPIERWIQPCVP